MFTYAMVPRGFLSVPMLSRCINSGIATAESPCASSSANVRRRTRVRFTSPWHRTSTKNSPVFRRQEPSATYPHAINVSPFQRRNIPFAGYTSAFESKNTRRRNKNTYFQQTSRYLCFISLLSNCEQTLQFKKPIICLSCSRRRRLKAVDST